MAECMVARYKKCVYAVDEFHSGHYQCRVVSPHYNQDSANVLLKHGYRTEQNNQYPVRRSETGEPECSFRRATSEDQMYPEMLLEEKLKRKE